MAETILITGGAGFIGSFLAESLVQDGHRVLILDNLATGRKENLDGVINDPKLEFIAGSVLDELAVDELVERCDTVVHLAAAVGVRLIVEQRLHSLITNIRGSEVVISAAHRYRKRLLIASTSEIYGKNTNVPLAEDADRVLGSPTVARWAYSTAKAVDEILSYAYYEERGLPVIVTRLFNTVGPRQSAAYGMVVPRLVGQALRNEPITVFGDGTQTRCFCHVADVVRAFKLLLATPEAVGEVVNVGSSEEVSILELAHRIIEQSGSDSTVELIPYERAYEEGFEDMFRRVPDTRKIRELTGWEPSIVLEDILSEVIADVRRSDPSARTG